MNCFVLGYSLITVVTGEKNQEYNVGNNNNWFIILHKFTSDAFWVDEKSTGVLIARDIITKK